MIKKWQKRFIVLDKDGFLASFKTHADARDGKPPKLQIPFGNIASIDVPNSRETNRDDQFVITFSAGPGSKP